MPTRKTYRSTGRRTTGRRTTSTGRTTRKFNRTTTRNNSTTNTTFSKNSPAFNRPKTECEWRIGSYRTVYSQFTGAGQQTPFSPTNANKWVKLVNQGCRVYKFTNKDFCQRFGTQWQQGTPTACFRYLRQKFGPSIKAVTRGKGNNWLVATTPNISGRPFQNYSWK
jgi:hypothetical protein